MVPSGNRYQTSKTGLAAMASRVAQSTCMPKGSRKTTPRSLGEAGHDTRQHLVGIAAYELDQAAGAFDPGDVLAAELTELVERSPIALDENVPLKWWIDPEGTKCGALEEFARFAAAGPSVCAAAAGESIDINRGEGTFWRRLVLQRLAIEPKVLVETVELLARPGPHIAEVAHACSSRVSDWVQRRLRSRRRLRSPIIG